MLPAFMTLFLAVILAPPAAAQEEPCRQVKDCPKNECCPLEALTPEVCQRFCGPLSFQPRQRPVQARVVVRQWHIANQETEEIPHKGLLIVHVCAGKLSTEAGGKPTEWDEGSFWSVPAGQRLIVYTARDSVILQTVEFVIPSREEQESDLLAPGRSDS